MSRAPPLPLPLFKCATHDTTCYDPSLWKKQSLSILKSNSFDVPFEPYARFDFQSSKKLMKILKTCLNLFITDK